MFPSVTTPLHQTRSGTWPRYNCTPLTGYNNTFPQLDSLFPHIPSSSQNSTPIPTSGTGPPTPQSASYPLSFHPSNRPTQQQPQQLQSSPIVSSPNSIPISSSCCEETRNIIDPLQTPFVHRQSQRYSAPPAFDTPMSEYPNTPSPPQSFGINGSLLITDQGIAMRSNSNSLNGGECHDVFMSKIIQPLSTNNNSSSTTSSSSSRPVLRPSLSHNAVQPTPSPLQPSAWPRRMMTTGMLNNTVMGFERDQNQNQNHHHHQKPLTTGTIGNVQVTTPLVNPASIGFATTNTNSETTTNNNTTTPEIIPPLQHEVTATTSTTTSSESNNNTTASSSGQTVPSASSTNSTSTPQFQHQLQQLSLSTTAPPPPPPQSSSTSSNSVGNHFATHSQPPHYPPPYPHPHHYHHGLIPSYYSNDDLSAYTSYQGAYEAGTYASVPWSSHPSSLDYHHHMPAYYHHPHHPAGLPPMQSPYKQDEPILAPGELPAPRPPNSYAALIGEALLLAPPPHQLYVSEISESVKRRYAYYRQNPSKIYNGVRHQTSMCKAFVKLPRPFGDQSGGARKWAIRAGCEGWFLNGGYTPPGSNNAVTNGKGVKGSNGIGKAKSTARAKALAIGTSVSSSSSSRRLSDRTDDSLTPSYSSSFSQGGGPSVGPAWDPSRSSYPHPQPQSQSQNQTPYSSLPTATNGTTGGYPYPTPGYHYVPISHPHPPPQQSLPNLAHGASFPQQAYPYYPPIWGPFGNPQGPVSPIQSYPSSAPATTNALMDSPASSTDGPHQWRGSAFGSEHEYHHEGLADSGHSHPQTRPMTTQSVSEGSVQEDFGMGHGSNHVNLGSGSPLSSSHGHSPERYD